MTRGDPTYGTDPVVPPESPESTMMGNYQADGTSAGDQETPSLTDRAGDLAGQARQTASQVTSQVSDQAQQTAQTQLASRKAQASSGLDSVAGALHQVGQQLRQNDQQQIGHYADLAAGQVSRASGYLRERNLNQLVDDAQDFARRQPEIFLGGAFVLGLIGARFLKASGRKAEEGTRSDSAWRGRETRGGYGGLGYGSRMNDLYDRPQDRVTPDTSPMGRQGASRGVYDPGSEGVDMREVPR